MLFCMLWFYGASVHGQLKLPPTLPENEFIAYNDSRSYRSLDANDLADALGIMQWNFVVQVTNTSFSTFTIGLHLIENGSDGVLGQISIGASDTEGSGKPIEGPRQ